MVLPLALILCFMIGCQDKEAMNAQAEVEEQKKGMFWQKCQGVSKRGLLMGIKGIP